MEFLMTLLKCVWVVSGIALGLVVLYAIISVPFRKRRKEKFKEELLTDLSNELVATFKESMKEKEAIKFYSNKNGETEKITPEQAKKELEDIVNGNIEKPKRKYTRRK